MKKETLKARCERLECQVASIKAERDDLLLMLSDEVRAMECRRGEHYGSEPREKLKYILQSMHQVEVDAIAGCKHFRDDCVNWLRAVSMVVESVGNAVTHNEKSARCRGAVELIESAIRKLREREFDRFGWRFWLDDVFRSDYPTREHIRRIHELEDELKNVRESNKT